MGAGMNKILPGLYVGSIRDSKDMNQLKANNITHILSVYDDAKEGNLENIKYLCFTASDHASQDLKQYFEKSIDFIHSARLSNGNVLVHCLAGVSRSATLAISYIMTVSEMPWYDSLNTCRAAREVTNPNFGFQRQLQNFEFTSIKTVREGLYSKYGVYDNKEDLNHCKTLLVSYQQKQDQLKSTNISSDQKVNYNAIKTYPLAFNAYNLDEEKSVDSSKKTKTRQSGIKNAETNELTEEQKKIEKEEIVDKIFG